MEATDVFVWKRFPRFAVRETSVDLLWVGGVLMIAFSFANLWLGVVIGGAIWAVIPARRLYPAVRKFVRRGN
jgi:hypothetical protein